MNRTIKDATVRRTQHPTHSALREHLATFLAAYNFARLTTPRGLTPLEAICNAFADEPAAFIRDPAHLIARPKT